MNPRDQIIAAIYTESSHAMLASMSFTVIIMLLVVLAFWFRVTADARRFEDARVQWLRELRHVEDVAALQLYKGNKAEESR